MEISAFDLIALASIFRFYSYGRFMELIEHIARLPKLLKLFFPLKVGRVYGAEHMSKAASFWHSLLGYPKRLSKDY